MKKSFLISIATLVLMIICVITATFAWFVNTEQSSANAMGITASVAPQINITTEIRLDENNVPDVYSGAGTGIINFNKADGYFPTAPTKQLTFENYKLQETWVTGFLSGTTIQFSYSNSEIIFGSIVVKYNNNEESGSINVPVTVDAKMKNTQGVFTSSNTKIKCVLFYDGAVVASNSSYKYVRCAIGTPVTERSTNYSTISKKSNGSVNVTAGEPTTLYFVIWFDGESMKNTETINDQGKQGLVDFYFGNSGL